jgi:Tol biopolymer transport system component
LANVRQLTFGGENAEAYFSFDGSRLVFQSTRPPHRCDQIYTMSLDGSATRLVSTGTGRTTCSFFFPDGKTILYSSTHATADTCPPRPSYSKGYVWAVYSGYDIFQADLEGRILKRLTETQGYDAEATIAPDGSRIVFTSDRDGDLEIYSMALDGSDVKRLTHSPGYDGGAFFSADSRQICYRAHCPKDSAQLEDDRRLLKEHLVRPTVLDLMVMDADGGNPRVVLSNGAANFGPYFHPSGEKIIFASNMNDPKGRNFDLFLVGVDGSGPEQVTFDETFDGFPMFSPDGRRLVFASNRNSREQGETNIFLADWVE